MTQTLLATGLIVALILALSLLVMTARSALSPAKPVTLTVNGDREVTATTGSACSAPSITPASRCPRPAPAPAPAANAA